MSESTTTDVERTSAAEVATRIGQATAVEQARAVAEVQAAIVVAQQCPRDIGKATAQMRMSCDQMRLAERAFFRFPRGGSTVTGASVHLARELARCWGNLQYGISELRRDDEHGQSEMLAFAWDVETNTRASHTFIVPHRRDTQRGVVDLTDLRDIYENNANNGARRVREAIFAVLPPWFVEDAKTLCSRTVTAGDGTPLIDRIEKAVNAYAERGITRQRLEARLGRKSAQWTPEDVAQLLVIFQSLARGEVTLEEEFPQERVTAGEIRARQAAADTDDPDTAARRRDRAKAAAAPEPTLPDPISPSTAKEPPAAVERHPFAAPDDGADICLDCGHGAAERIHQP